MKKIFLLVFVFMTLSALGQEGSFNKTQYEIAEHDIFYHCTIDNVEADYEFRIRIKEIEVGGGKWELTALIDYRRKGMNYFVNLYSKKYKQKERYWDDAIDDARLYIINDIVKIKP